MPTDLSERLERFYDAVPRADATVETVGAFTVFAPRAGGFPYYARPTLGATAFTAADVDAVRARQRELGVPEAFEWQHETTPGLGEVLRGCGLSVHEHPLQVLDGDVRAPAAGTGVELTELTGDTADADLRTALAVADVGFTHGGTAVGTAGTDALRAAEAKVGDPAVDRCRERLVAGRALMVLAHLDGAPAAVASAQLAAGVAEVVGVATLPVHRGRGLGAAVTAATVRSATAAGVHTVFLSASDDDVARLYARLGFHRVGTAGIAEAR